VRMGKENLYRILVWKPDGRKIHIAVDWTIIFKLILKKSLGRAQTGFMWLSLVRVCGLLYTR
jgi:hypothetical protein